MKKKMHNGIGLLPNCLVKKKNCIATLQLYCKREGWKKKNCIAIVLQEKGVVRWFVLQWADIVLQYRSFDKGIGSQYTDCIVTRRG